MATTPSTSDAMDPIKRANDVLAGTAKDAETRKVNTTEPAKGTDAGEVGKKWSDTFSG